MQIFKYFSLLYLLTTISYLTHSITIYVIGCLPLIPALFSPHPFCILPTPTSDQFSLQGMQIFEYFPLLYMLTTILHLAHSPTLSHPHHSHLLPLTSHSHSHLHSPSLTLSPLHHQHLPLACSPSTLASLPQAPPSPSFPFTTNILLLSPTHLLLFPPTFIHPLPPAPACPPSTFAFTFASLPHAPTLSPLPLTPPALTPACSLSTFTSLLHAPPSPSLPFTTDILPLTPILIPASSCLLTPAHPPALHLHLPPSCTHPLPFATDTIPLSPTLALLTHSCSGLL